MRVVVIRHHDVDSAGFIGEAFEARGATLDTRLFPDEGPLPGLDGIDHIVVLGAIPSVNDDLPWIAQELAWLLRADAAGIPVLGICFGGQALCKVFGGTVEKAPRQEIGWTMVEPVATPAGPAPAGPAPVVPAGPWMEFHGDRCLLPPSARLLAANDLCAQAFTIGRHLGVQFHPEVDGEQLKRWLYSGGGGDAEAAAHGLDPAEFLAQTIREEPAARARADQLVATALAHALTAPVI